MYAEKILGIVNARCKNAGKRQSMLKKYSDSSMQVEKMLGIVNARCKNTRKSSMYAEKILGIVNAKWENARNYRCKAKEC